MLRYLIENTAVSHYSSLRVDMLIRPFPFDRDNPLYLHWNDNFPDLLSGQVLRTQNDTHELFLSVSVTWV